MIALPRPRSVCSLAPTTTRMWSPEYGKAHLRRLHFDLAPCVDQWGEERLFEHTTGNLGDINRKSSRARRRRLVDRRGDPRTHGRRRPAPRVRLQSRNVAAVSGGTASPRLPGAGLSDGTAGPNLGLVRLGPLAMVRFFYPRLLGRRIPAMNPGLGVVPRSCALGRTRARALVWRALAVLARDFARRIGR